MLLRASIAFAIALAGVAACKKGPSYHRDSPEATLRSFTKAINDGRFPDDISRLIIDDVEQRQWRMRCTSRGCRKAEFNVVEHGPMSDYRAVLFVDYEVRGDLDGVVSSGKRTPIVFERDGSRWFIARIGEEKPVQLEQPAGPLRRAPADGGVPPEPAELEPDGG